VSADTSGERPQAEQAGPEEQAQPAGVDLQAALGGKLGITESGLPSVVFIVVYTVNGQVLTPALWGALATAAVLTVVRIARRSSLQFALAGMFGVALSAFIASRTGNAANFYLPGLLMQAGYAVAYLVSILIGWPLIGVVLGPLLGEGFTWRDDPARRRAYSQASWLWFGMFAVRLAVQLPLYLLTMTVALGWVKVAMGWPLFLLVLWLNYLVLRKAPPPRPRSEVSSADRPSDPGSGHGSGPDSDPEKGSGPEGAG
jgi:hypothetical protein